MSRRFEFVGGTSAKFWEIDHSGKDVTVRYGRLGTEGQSQTKSFATDQKAQEHADKLIESKVAKGYQECTSV